MQEKRILYVHGMGGGADSRIPSILSERLAADDIKVVVRTYDFDPEIAAAQLDSWMDEIRPDLIIGESLGAVHALRLRGVPHLFVSPALNAPAIFHTLAFLALIPGVRGALNRIYKPREGNRQKIDYRYSILRKYKRLRGEALQPCGDYLHAFFGTEDHYRRSGVVSLRTWRRYFGESFTEYHGTHYMEEEYIGSLLIPAICSLLKG